MTRHQKAVREANRRRPSSERSASPSRPSESSTLSVSLSLGQAWQRHLTRGSWIVVLEGVVELAFRDSTLDGCPDLFVHPVAPSGSATGAAWPGAMRLQAGEGYRMPCHADVSIRATGRGAASVHWEMAATPWARRTARFLAMARTAWRDGLRRRWKTFGQPHRRD